MKPLTRLLILTLSMTFGLFSIHSYADMPSKKDWQKARHKSAKGSGVGKALGNWSKCCGDPKDFSAYQEFKDAYEGIETLEKALDTAENKVSSKKDKKKESTENFIATARNEINDYKKELKEDIERRQKIVDDLIKDVEDKIKETTKSVKKLHDSVNDEGEQIGDIAKEIDTNKDLTSEELGDFNNDLKKSITVLEKLSKDSHEELGDLRGDKAIVAVRGKGATGICKLNGLEDDACDFSKAFDENMKLFKEAEDENSSVKTDASKYISQANVYAALADTSMSDVDKELVRLNALGDQIAQQDKNSKIIVSKSAGDFLKKSAAKSKEEIERTKKLIDTQIKITEDKVANAKKILNTVQKLTSDLDKMPTALSRNGNITRVYGRHKNSGQVLIRTLNVWIIDAEEGLALWEN